MTDRQYGLPSFERDESADIYTVPMRFTGQMLELIWGGIDCANVRLVIIEGDNTTGPEATLQFGHLYSRRARLFNRLAKRLRRA